MKLLNIVKDEKAKLAIQTEHGIIDVSEANSQYNLSFPTSFQELIVKGEKGIEELEDLIRLIKEDSNATLVDENSITYAASIGHPEKIICIGLNYISHAEESKMEIPKEPVIFSKFNNSIAAHKQEIPLPLTAEKYDYEAELVLIIGKEAKNISVEEAKDYIFGYSVGNDLSARDLQMKSGQWLIGKTLDHFAPIGPYTVPSKFIEDPHHLEIKCEVNGEVRQQANTKDMIFNCYEIVSYISKYMTLKPGDIIFTGTPEGVILGYPEAEQVWLKPKDKVSVSIEKIGTLKNTLV